LSRQFELQAVSGLVARVAREVFGGLFRYLFGRCFPSDSRRLICEAAPLLWAVRLALWVLPFRGIEKLLATPSRRTPPDGASVVPEQVARAVRLAGRCVPAATCLAQAIVAVMLLRRRGHDAALRIGVRRPDRRAFDAHAWVECNQRIVIGLIDALDEYTPLPHWAAAATGT